jgi:hypothetical protein
MQEIPTANSVLKDYLTKAELAAQLDRSVRSIDRWSLTGYGPPSVRIGRRSLYRREAVLEWLRSLESSPKHRERARLRP